MICILLVAGKGGGERRGGGFAWQISKNKWRMCKDGACTLHVSGLKVMDGGRCICPNTFQCVDLCSVYILYAGGKGNNCCT